MFTLDTTPQWTEDGAIGETGPPAPLRVVSDYVREHVTAQTQGSFSSSQSVFFLNSEIHLQLLYQLLFFLFADLNMAENTVQEKAIKWILANLL